MNGTRFPNVRRAFNVTVGTAMLLGIPLLAQADQGKWWTPKEGGRKGESQVREESRDGRGHAMVWRGARVHRDVIVIREGRRGGSMRARRCFIRPRFHRHVVYVRPVRYFISADAHIGGIGIHARFRPHYLYGCNFCDSRFESYGAYRSHVVRCDARPDVRGVIADDWEGDWGAAHDARYADDGWDD